jgi:hypothetical protein
VWAAVQRRVSGHVAQESAKRRRRRTREQEAVDVQSCTDLHDEASFHKQAEMRNINLLLWMQPGPVPRSAADSTKCTAALVNSHHRDFLWVRAGQFRAAWPTTLTLLLGTCFARTARTKYLVLLLYESLWSVASPLLDSLLDSRTGQAGAASLSGWCAPSSAEQAGPWMRPPIIAGGESEGACHPLVVQSSSSNGSSSSMTRAPWIWMRPPGPYHLPLESIT